MPANLYLSPMPKVQLSIVSLVFYVLTISWSTKVASQTFEISGRVQDADTQEYLENVVVSLSDLKVKSTGGGYFFLKGIPADNYNLALSLQGYNTHQQKVVLNENRELGTIYMTKTGTNGTTAALHKTIRANNVIRLLHQRSNMQGGNMVYGIPPDPITTEGNTFLDSKWNPASLLLYRDQKVLDGYLVRYNIASNDFEFFNPENQNVSKMAGTRVQNVVWADTVYKVPRYFVNGMDYINGSAPILGFMEVLVEGEIPLMRRTAVVYKKANYNTALMVGNKNNKWIKHDIYYYASGKELVEVPGNRKKFFQVFGNKADIMAQYVESNDFSIKDPSAIFQIFTYYNAQFEGFQPIMDRLLKEY